MTANNSRVVLVWGTRPEHIKMFPVWKELSSRQGIELLTVFTGQHHELVDHENLAIPVDIWLDVMRKGQSLPELMARLLQELSEKVVGSAALVVVQGDTSTALAGAISSFYAGIPVAHVEAGLTTWDPFDPFPEEMHRRLIARIAQIHFTPTSTSYENLMRMGVERDQISLTGNTVVDALYYMREFGLDFPVPPGDEVLVTLHRRENEPRLPVLCKALNKIQSELKPRGFRLVFVAHPRSEEVAHELLRSVQIISAMDYPGFLAKAARAAFLLTDSGGLQEEATVLGVPVVVVRRKTERPEAVEAGCSRVAGVEPDGIIAETLRIADAVENSTDRQSREVFGDGRAAVRIADVIESWMGNEVSDDQAPAR